MLTQTWVGEGGEGHGKVLFILQVPVFIHVWLCCIFSLSIEEKTQQNWVIIDFFPFLFLDLGLQGLREKGQSLLDQISNQASWAYGKDVTIENKENVDHIQGVMEDMQLRKQR